MGLYDQFIADAESRYGLPTGLLGAVINLGERSGAKATSPKGAMGVGQLMPGTAADLGVKDPYDPQQSIDGAGRYLKQQLDAFGGDQTKAVAAYNAGPGAVKKYGGVPPYGETQRYVKRVLGPDAMASNSLPSAADLLSGKATPAAPVSGGGSGALPSPTDLLQPNAPAPRTSAPRPKPQSLAPGPMAYVGGLMANVNRGLGVGDELAAGANTVVNATKDALAGRQGPGWAGRFQGELAKQRGLEDAFMNAHRVTADLARGAGMAGQAVAPIGVAAPALRGGSLAGNIARGAVSAAIPGYASGFADRGSLQERISAGNTGALVGGALGAVGGAIASRRPKAPTPSLDAQRARVADTLDQMGVDVNAMPADTVQQADDLLRAGHKPEDVAVAMAARQLPEPVPMTTGQLTGDPGQQLAENLSLRGANGAGASAIMRGQREAQQDALRGNVTAIASDLGGGTPAVQGDAGALASQQLNTMYDAANKRVDDAFKAARGAGEGVTLPRQEVPQLAARLRQSVSTYDPEAIAPVGRVLSRFDDLGGATQVRDLFEARSRLSTLVREGDRMNAGAARAAMRELDNFTDEAMTRDLFSGDNGAVAMWRDAIKQRREFGQQFESGDLIEKLTERTYRGGGRTLAVDPIDASNYIFGRNGLGTAGKQNLSRDVIRLRDTLGVDSDAWNAIRSEAFSRIASGGEGAYEGGARQFSGPKFAKAWEDFTRKSPSLAEALFSPEEISQINQFSSVAVRATSPVKGGDNSSNTAVAAKRLLMGLKFVRGVPFLRDAVDVAEQGLATRTAQRAAQGRLPRLPPPRAPAAGLPPAVARGIGVAAGSSQQSR